MLKNVSCLNVQEKERWERETVPYLVAAAPPILPNNLQTPFQVSAHTHPRTHASLQRYFLHRFDKVFYCLYAVLCGVQFVGQNKEDSPNASYSDGKYWAGDNSSVGKRETPTVSPYVHILFTMIIRRLRYKSLCISVQKNYCAFSFCASQILVRRSSSSGDIDCPGEAGTVNARTKIQEKSKHALQLSPILGFLKIIINLWTA